MIRLLTLPLAALLASGCVVNLGSHRGDDSLKINGVRLDEKHQETLLPGPWDENGLVIESHQGDIRVEATEGPNRIEVILFEIEPGDAYAVFEAGRLVAHSTTGRQTGIGDVNVFTNGALTALKLNTGLGDINMHGVHVLAEIVMSTGLGDIALCCAGEPTKVSLFTGMGDVSAETSAFGTLVASTGMGDVEVEKISATEATLSTGMGDVDVEECAFDHLEASTGMGDVDCANTACEKTDLSTGMGKVRRR